MRLNSLDVMRGSVMLLLTVIQPLILALGTCCASCGHPLPTGFLNAFTHVAWEGMALWDLVMPSFIFMCGAAIPFAVPKYLPETGCPGWAFWKHLLTRVSLLWILGLILQGNLLSFRWEQIFLFTNTLQAIAAGYALTALAFLIPCRPIRFALPFVLMALYGILLAVHGTYGPADNLAYAVEEFCLPSPRGDAKYTWILTTLMFAAMTMTGSICGDLLKREGSWQGKALRLGGLGALLLAAGGITACFVPMIKPIYTVSFTALAMGIDVLFLLLLFAVIDGLKLSFGTGLVTCFGRTALTAYFIHEFLYWSTFLPLGRRLVSGLARQTLLWGGWEKNVNPEALTAFAGACAATALFVWTVSIWSSRQTQPKKG